MPAAPEATCDLEPGWASSTHPGIRQLRLSGSLTFNLLRLALGALAFNLDPARPQDLRYLPHQLDGEQPVRQAGPRDLHMVGELKALLECAGADAAVQELPVRTG